VLARANNRAISLAVLGKRVGATTVKCCGQRIMIILSETMVMRPDTSSAEGSASFGQIYLGQSSDRAGRLTPSVANTVNECR
jgi:hypothetical protein